MFNRVVFFNQMRNGDVHVSRNFVKYLMKNIVSKKYIYAHSNDPKLIQDIDNLEYSPINFQIHESFPFQHMRDSLFINTWIGQRNSRYCGPFGCTYKSNIMMYNDLINNLNQSFGMKIPNITGNSFIPTIDYNKYDIKNVDNFMKDNDKRKVLICNGNAMSGQSENFDFDPIIKNISDKYPEILFFIANDTKIINTNVINNTKLINCTGSNLNENSYISTFCDIIIGKISGPHTFSLVQNNLFDKSKTMISICHRQEEGIWYPESEAKIIWTNKFDIENLTTLITKTIGI